MTSLHARGVYFPPGIQWLVLASPDAKFFLQADWHIIITLRDWKHDFGVRVPPLPLILFRSTSVLFLSAGSSNGRRRSFSLHKRPYTESISADTVHVTAIIVDDYSLSMQREEYEEVAFCNPRSEEQEQ